MEGILCWLQRGFRPKGIMSVQQELIMSVQQKLIMSVQQELLKLPL